MFKHHHKYILINTIRCYLHFHYKQNLNLQNQQQTAKRTFQEMTKRKLNSPSTYFKTNLNRTKLIAFQKTVRSSAVSLMLWYCDFLLLSQGLTWIITISFTSIQSSEMQCIVLVFSWFNWLFTQSHLMSLEHSQFQEKGRLHSGLSYVQCDHTSLAHRWLWRSQHRAEGTSSVNTCSREQLTFV